MLSEAIAITVVLLIRDRDHALNCVCERIHLGLKRGQCDYAEIRRIRVLDAAASDLCRHRNLGMKMQRSRDNRCVLETRLGYRLSDGVHDRRNACLTLRFGNQVNLVQNQNHLIGRDLPDDHALRGLCLNSLHAVDHDKQHVDDLSASQDGANKTGVTGAVHQRVLDVFVSVAYSLCLCSVTTCDSARQIRNKRTESQIQRNPALTTLRILVQRSRRQYCTQRLH